MNRDGTIYVAKTKALISYAIIALLSCAFVMAYAKKSAFLMTGLNYVLIIGYQEPQSFGGASLRDKIFFQERSLPV